VLPVPAEAEAEALSLDVTQCRTRTQKRMSALQHMRQIQPGSPFKTMRIVRFTAEVVSVASEPTSEREAVRWRVGDVACL
jgi:hypothetical protein